MTSKRTKEFRELLSCLPADVQRQAIESYKLFRDDPSHPSLRFKKVHATQPIYSARVSRDYRSLAYLDGDWVIWFWIGPHDDYDKLLRRI